ncbi:8-oxo-dGTP pyrophosphatase MutT and related house-cleaning NTP pyrophosphohydrolases [Commensalibacter communis]|uniref:RNA pyrophosphohydrolase n=1 Tax=Commensalibacter communis TaxID=2972786 RepID=UPI0022FF792D|nr:RNA pyrophosphohydrolase [Commensalibacter communis]CAI3926340.1 8-oxo-dGTP pyrophosphatase MutT and related house-cleaning NTP pyrophosphohydrolases [Commensalibacter communis]CAI3933029.1 8-oxo-dGTP pyrophosphatase MutT and related house-cleaning NTP pyrophosphohydrolases [Commensalibacter communis]
MTDLPYRPNVAAIIFNPKGKIFIALRHDLAKEGIWSFPQGGIDANENPSEAIKRELAEEIGTDQIEILEEYPEWLSYDFPPDVLLNPLKGKYKGQTQKWFAVRFTGKDEDINLDKHVEKEFDEWKWIDITELKTIKTGYKHDIYMKISDHFKKYTHI